MAMLPRDDVTWQEWSDVRARAHGAPDDVISRIADELSDWPDAVRLVASDPEQQEDPWWIEGQQPTHQPWLSLVRSLWIGPDELHELAPDSAWTREGFRAITRWIVDYPRAAEVIAAWRSYLPSLATIDLSHFTAGPRELETWLPNLAPVGHLNFGSRSVRLQLIDVLIAEHARTLRALDFTGVGIGLAGLRRFARWPETSPLRHLGLRDTAIDLAMLERVQIPCIRFLASLDLSAARRPARQYRWLDTPGLLTLSLQHVPLGDTSRTLFAEANLPRLQALRLSATRITVSGLEALSRASCNESLTRLDLRDNGLPDEALEVLDYRTGWQQLLLSGNHFTAPALERVAERHDLVMRRPGAYERVERLAR